MRNGAHEKANGEGLLPLQGDGFPNHITQGVTLG